MSATAPLASIAMPVRDAAPWLQECLASVLGQDEGRFELLAVDDASTDGSRAMLEQAATRDSRIRVLGTEPGRGGIVPALNLALAEARAPVLVRMDADDFMHPSRLARQLAALDADSGLFAVSCRADAFPADECRDGMRAYLDWQNGLLGAEELARDRFVESPVLHPTIAMRTRLVREVLGGWRDVPWPEDWDFFLRAFEAGLRVARLPEVLHGWRLHPAQATHNHERYRADALLEARAHFLARRLVAPLASGRAVVVLGAGPVGKALTKALHRHAVPVAALVDVDPRKVGGVVRGEGANWKVLPHAALAGWQPRPFAVSAVSGVPARDRVRGELRRLGWSEGDDFVVAA